ncbi:putative membrane protein YccC [Roseiarcus fermentans]|uniref:Putative membrane protein YccC n=1 Tax=Roseiarcus fermentans TaxID=1473586 RepID=A0A366FLS0_9HYPH|nr:FUSC family protein [Roseiarcus fermentans]RBP15537.1 putative membrane protein YccC [Roseiarcus fermentans]
MSQAQHVAKAAQAPIAARLPARAVGPLLYGLRLWGSICLSLYLAFALELSDPSWAATTAGLVCLPQLGASLRKSSYRLAGTVAGGIAIVVLAAAFPQNRAGFLIGLAAWGAACGFVAGLLRNFAAYGAGLAGFTAAVIGGDVMGPTGGLSDEIATLACNRVVEIVIGIVSAGVVLALTDLGGARRRLGADFASVAAAVFSGFVGSVSAREPDGPATRAARREIMRRVIALDPLIDTAMGEASDLRYRSRILQSAVDGLIATMTAWRTLAVHLARSSGTGDDRGAQSVVRILDDLRPTADEAIGEAPGLRDACRARAGAVARIAPDSPSSQLLADAAAQGLLGMAQALNGLTLIVDPERTRRPDARAALYPPDWLPPTIIAARAFATIGLVMLFWVVTAWPSGPVAITFATVAVVIFPLQGDQAYSAAASMFVGCALSAVLSAILVFGILPGVAGFPGLCLALGLLFVPLGVLAAWPIQPKVLTSVTVFIMPLASLKNVMAYDAAQFGNTVLAILAGIAAGAVMILIVPPLTPAARTRRLLRFGLSDLRRLARGRGPRTLRAWEGRAAARIKALPDEAAPIERACMASTLTVGSRIIRLRGAAPQFLSDTALDAALEPIAAGRVAAALDGLAALDRALTVDGGDARIALTLRAAILAMTEELTAHPEFYEERG